jgi:hypothetical protein
VQAFGVTNPGPRRLPEVLELITTYVRTMVLHSDISSLDGYHKPIETGVVRLAIRLLKFQNARKTLQRRVIS